MSLTYTLTPAPGPRIGLVVLQADETLERDMRRLLPLDAEVLVTRVPSGTQVTQESLARMEANLTGAAALFPRHARFAAIGYGCTSGTAQIGAERIADLVRAGAGAGAVTEPVSALIAACRALGARRIGMISPYVASVSARLRAVLGQAGIATPAFASFDEPEERRVVRIGPDAVHAAACGMARAGGCDALFMSCTNLRTLDVIEGIEAETDLPVLSSNQVLAWHLAHLSGLEAAFRPGRLWETRPCAPPA